MTRSADEEMGSCLHITNGDCAGGLLEKSGLPGDVLVWRDILYDGPRVPGWPDEDTLKARALFLAEMTGTPLPWIPAAVTRWLQEQPDPISGPGRLEQLAFDAIRKGNETPADLLESVAAADTPPQFWGDTTLWGTINGLANRMPPLVKIAGPADHQPQWQSEHSLTDFRITALPTH